MLRRFQISHNVSLDGVLDFLNSKRMTDAGPVDLINDSDDDEDTLAVVQADPGQGLPGAGARTKRAVVRTKCLRISPTGQAWAAATTEGVLVYSLDEGMVFDPSDLDMDVTPEVRWLEKGDASKESRVLVPKSQSAAKDASLHCRVDGSQTCACQLVINTF